MNNTINFNELFSQIRLSSYNNDIVKHYDNLKCVGKITPKLATLEIILRNKLDNKLSEKDNDWIKNSNDEKIKKSKEEIEHREKNRILSHHQYLSRISLGTIIHLIKENKLQNSIMDLKNINFRNYNQYNRNFFFENGIKTTKIKNTHIGVDPQKIDFFLSDLIKTFNEKILEYC
ncbi:hypothetical protein ACFF5N_001588 [Campylobacter jejuni]|nr:hypothetical protein [Campylobacter coli]EHD2716268.1 hypothetical protein [Campylobacter coli]